MAFNVTETLVATNCNKCGIVFAFPENWKAARTRDSREFWCPNGHPLHYPDKSEDEKAESARVLDLRQQLTQALHRAEQAEARAEELAGPDARAVKPVPAAPDLPTPATATTINCPKCGQTYKAGSVICLVKHLREKHGLAHAEASALVNGIVDAAKGEGVNHG